MIENLEEVATLLDRQDLDGVQALLTDANRQRDRLNARNSHTNSDRLS